MNNPWWLRSLGYGVGAMIPTAIFGDMILGVAVFFLPLSQATAGRWHDNPPVGALCLIVGALVAVFALGLHRTGRAATPIRCAEDSAHSRQ